MTRRLQLYGIGSAKTGTHSLAAMFARDFRSAHEARADVVVAMTGRLQRGGMAPAVFDAWLRDRDRRLGLEVDVSSLNGPLAPRLARLFPEAKFVLTLREPVGWLDSMLNQQLVSGVPAFWEQARLQAFGPLPQRWPPREAWLAEHRLHPLSTLLRYWSRRNLALIDGLPAERLLVLRTRELDTRAAELAAFAGVRVEQLDLSRTHEFRGGRQVRAEALFGADYVRQQVLAAGRPLLQRCFPRRLAVLEAGNPPLQ